MGDRKSILQIILAVVLMLTAVLMVGCRTDEVAKRAENEEKLLKAMTEYPGEGLYDPEVTVIGLGAPEPTEEELVESQQRAAEEKDAWRDAVGDCFAEGMFDTFYGEWFRNGYLGVAWANGLSTAITEFSITDDASQDPDNIEHALITVTATDKEGTPMSFVMDWQVIFDKNHPDLIQKINLIDDGGFWDAYTSLSLEKKETEKDSLDNLQAYVDHIETGLVDENGCAKDDEAFKTLLNQFYKDAKTACDNGAYQDIRRGDDYVALLLNSGLVFVYSPYREGILSGSGTHSDFSMTLFNVLDSEKEVGTPQYFAHSDYYDHYEGLQSAVTDSEYDIEFTHYRNFECDLDAYKQLLTEGKRIIYLGGHGWYVEDPESGKCGTLILSGIRYDENKKAEYKELNLISSEEDKDIDWTTRKDWLIAGLFDDSYHRANIVVNQDLCIYLSPSFFRELSDSDYLKDSVVFLGACSSVKSGADNTLVGTLLDKGADVVIGYSEPVKFIYDSALSDNFLQGIVNKGNSEKSFRDLLQLAQKYAEEKIDIGFFGNDKDFGTDHSNDYTEDGSEVNCEALLFGDKTDKAIEEWLNPTAAGEMSDGHIVLSGTIDTFNYEETIELQGTPDPNAGYTDASETYHLIVLDTPQTLKLVSGDGQGHSEHEAKMIRVRDVTNEYDGQHITFSIDPEKTRWPSDTSMPVGEPSTSDIVFIDIGNRGAR